MSRTVVRSAGFAAVVGTLLVVAVCGAAGVATEGVAAGAINETNVTHHDNPETVDERGDSDRVSDWLSGRLTDRLRESSIRISQGQYETADDVLGDEFDQRLGQYVDVAGETDSIATTGSTGDGNGDGDGEDSETEDNALDRARDNQRELASLRTEYEETYAAYREAREQGDSMVARQYARRLKQLAADIRQRGANVTRSLQTIENRTGQNTSDIENRTRNEVENVTELTEEVQLETFVETSLNVSTNRSVASFVDPVQVRGRLVTANGTAVANRSIRLQVGQRTFTTTTGPNGTVAVTYRPVFVPAAAETVPVQYQPNVTAPYLGTATNASLAIEQTEATLTATVRPRRAGVGDVATLETSLSVAGRPVADVPITATLAGRSLAEDRTESDGTARLRRRVPVAVPPGETAVRASIALENRALASENATATLLIHETDTELSINATHTGQTIVVTGRLTAATGEATPVPSQSVVVTVANVTRTVPTDSQGRYETTLSESVVPASAEESIRVRSRFDARGSALESARAETRLNVSGIRNGTGETSDSGLLAVLGWRRLGGVGVLLLGGGVFAWRWWRHEDTEESAPSEDPTPTAPEPAGSSDTTDQPVLGDAQKALAAGRTNDAIVSAYGVVRASLTDQFDIRETITVRELLAACEHHLDTESYATLRTLTEAYERTVFAPDDVEAAGQAAIDAAQTLLDSRPSRSDDPADD